LGIPIRGSQFETSTLQSFRIPSMVDQDAGLSSLFERERPFTAPFPTHSDFFPYFFSSSHLSRTVCGRAFLRGRRDSSFRTLSFFHWSRLSPRFRISISPRIPRGLVLPGALVFFPSLDLLVFPQKRGRSCDRHFDTPSPLGTPMTPRAVDSARLCFLCSVYPPSLYAPYMRDSP